MPHQSCTVCSHKNIQEINLALRKGSPTLRALAVQTGLSKTALIRHKRHIDHPEPRIKGNEIDAIDQQIARLQRAQRRAQRSRTRHVMVSIAKELRAWISLKSKVQGQSAMQLGEIAPEPAISPRDALALAEAVIEMNLAGDQRPHVLQWLDGLRSPRPKALICSREPRLPRPMLSRKLQTAQRVRNAFAWPLHKQRDFK
jgi:hypothetical protein